MIKKLIFWSLVVAGGLFVINTVRPGSVHTAWKRAQAKFDRKVSPEFELARIRDQIAQLTPDMHRNIARIAEAMVEVQSLEKRAGDLEVRLEGAKKELAQLTEAVETGDTKRVSLSGRNITRQVNDKLRTCKNLEGELTRTQRILEAKKRGVEAARQRLGEMKAQQQELRAMAEEYEAKLQELALEQTRKEIQLDDSRLAEIKASFEALQKKIDVVTTEVELQKDFSAGTLTEKKPETNKDVVTEAREYLGKSDTAKK